MRNSTRLNRRSMKRCKRRGTLRKDSFVMWSRGNWIIKRDVEAGILNEWIKFPMRLCAG